MHRVLVFGSSNVGKTSMLNMLCDQNQPVSSAAIGCTFETDPFPPFTRNNINYEFYDTAGLHEADAHTVTSDRALRNILTLLKSCKDGFNLLIFVVRIGAVHKADEMTYKIFVDILTQNKIPCICVITNCENEDPMSEYGTRNRGYYERQGMVFMDIMSTCFAKGGRLEEHYKSLREESKKIVWQMIDWYASPKPITFFDVNDSLIHAFKRTWNVFCNWIEMPNWQYTTLDQQLGVFLDSMGINDEFMKNAFCDIVRDRKLE